MQSFESNLNRRMRNAEDAANEMSPRSLSFNRRETASGEIEYKFPLVCIIFKPREGEDIPEFFFATYSKDVSREYTYKRADQDPQCTMEYVTKCLHIAAEDAGYKILWFRPSDADAKPGETAKKALENILRVRRARVALFKKYWNIEESPDGQGYLIKL